MNIIKITLYAQAYYSGATYYEELYLPEDYFRKEIEDILPDEMCVGELDGKHSEVWGDVEFTLMEATQLSEEYKPKKSDCSYDYLQEELANYSIDCSTNYDEFIRQVEKANTFLATVDREIELSIKINSKYKEDVQRLLNELETVYGMKREINYAK